MGSWKHKKILLLFDNVVLHFKFTTTMKQIAVTIPDNKESLFIELMKSISFVKEIETIEDFEIPEEQKQIVRKRIKASETEPSRLLKWDEVKNKIKC